MTHDPKSKAQAMRHDADSGRRVCRRLQLVRKTTASLLVVATAACATSAPDIPPEQVVPKTERYATRVMMLRSCPVTGDGEIQPAKLNGMVAMLLPIAADFLTGAIVAAIKERQEGLTVTYLGRGASKFIGPEGEMKCLVIVRGSFGSGGTNVGTAKSGSIDAGVIKDVGLTGFPDLYFEAQLSRQSVAGDTDQVLILPQVLYFRNTAAPYVEKAAKSLLFSLRLAPALPPAAPEDKPGESSINFFFGDVPLGTEVHVGLDGGDPFADQAVAVSIKDADLEKILNMHVQITESEDPSLIAKAFAAALEKNKDKLSTGLQDLIKKALIDAKEEGGKP